MYLKYVSGPLRIGWVFILVTFKNKKTNYWSQIAKNNSETVDSGPLMV